MSQGSESVLHNPSGNVWIVALLVLCSAIIGYGAFYSTNAITEPAFLAGKYSVYALFLWGAFYAMFLRKRGVKVGSTAFAAIFAALFAGGLIAASNQKQQAVRALSSIQEEMSRVADAVASADSQGLPARIERSATLIPTAGGEYGVMERFAKQFIDRIVAERNDYLLEMDAIGWNSLLDGKRLKGDMALSESKVVIKRAKAIVDKYEKRTAALLEETRAQANAVNLSKSNRKAFLTGFEEGLSESASQIDELWMLEKHAVQQFEKIILLLASSKGWVVQGERILFYRDDELDRFNTHVANIQKIAQRQEQIQTRNRAAALRRLESSKTALQR